MDEDLVREAIALAEPIARAFEGCRTTAYQDVAGVWTIGIGHTGPEVHAGTGWSMARVEATFAADMQAAMHGVLRQVSVPLQPSQLAALGDFAFNLGLANLSRLAGHGLLAGDYDSIPRELPRWTLAGGRPRDALLRRRQAEIALWQSTHVPKAEAA